MATRITDESIELSNNVDIEVHTNSYRGVRGRSLLCAIFDEVAFWRSEDSANRRTLRLPAPLIPLLRAFPVLR